MSTVAVVILAAGEGSRMRSALTKVLHRAAGKPVVAHVVDAARAAGADRIALVVPPEHAAIREAIGDGVAYAVQDPPRGTGDAAECGLRALPGVSGPVVVLNGDGPCIRPETLAAMLAARGDADGVFLSVRRDDPTGYGRVIRDADGSLLRILEEADCNAEQRALQDVNAGVYLFDAKVLATALAALSPDNAQNELYLTDTLEVIREQGGRVTLYEHDDVEEVQGINTRAELARSEETLRRRNVDALMTAGVTVRSPETVFVDSGVAVGADTTIYPGVVLEAGTVVGSGCTIYPHTRIARSTVGDGVTILDGTVIEDSVVDDNATLGPYARLRPGAHVGLGAKVGNFVEMKNSTLGPGAKASHLTYLGDAQVGARANIGAGTITCNYDGKKKHVTKIGEGAFIGSNSALVAPVRIGRGAYVGAGSTITKDVPDDALAVARGRQLVKSGWVTRKKREEE
jgi:bifunctional UDP-N-acetylglucosamine pyrophosphorylase/glucosamine-1-phosphate N-acetyltransferase